MSDHGKAEILLIDDDPDICWGIGRILTRKGFRVTSCGDGIDALRFLSERDFDFIVTDINMPKMNGLKLLEWIQENKPATKVVVITGFGAPAMKRLSLGKGTILYLEKPVDPAMLVTLLNESLEEQKNATFSGHTSNIDLIDYIQFMLVTRKQAILEVESHDNQHGVIYFDKGNIPHVYVNDLSGQDAFYYVVGNFEGGRFNTAKWSPPTVETIQMPGEFLLMEAARIKDENSFGGGPRPGNNSHPPEAGPLDGEFNMDDFDLQFPE